MIPFKYSSTPAFFKNLVSQSFYWLAGIALLGLTSCQQRMELEKELSFPAKFVHTGFELSPSTYYQVEADGFREISDKGRLVEVDLWILEEAEEFFLYTAPFEVTLLSDSTVQFSVYDYRDPQSVLSAKASYRIEDDHLFIEYQGKVEFALIKNDDFDQLKMYAYCELHTSFDDFFQRREISPLTMYLEYTNNYPDFIPANGKFGLEAGLIYRPDQVSLDTNSIFEAPGAVDYAAAYIGLMISGRYYFSPKRLGKGLYLGAHLFIECWVVHNSEYNRLFTAQYGAESPGLENPWEYVAPGLQAVRIWV